MQVCGIAGCGKSTGVNNATVNHIPEQVVTSCAALNSAWSRHAPTLFSNSVGRTVADTDAALNWDAFLGRSVPSLGNPLSAGAPDFSPLHERGLKLSDLAALWQIEPLRERFMQRGKELESEPASASCDVLLASGGPAGEMLCEAFREHPQSTSHWSVRALLQNASLLGECDYSFRKWLERECRMLGEAQFPPKEFRRMVVTTRPSGGLGQMSLEEALVEIMGRVFHRVSPVVAAHMLSDWQLGLWMGGQTTVFDLFPYDAPHRQFLRSCASDFGAPPGGGAAFAKWWHEQPGCDELPPRLASVIISASIQN